MQKWEWLIQTFGKNGLNWQYWAKMGKTHAHCVKIGWLAHIGGSGSNLISLWLFEIFASV